MHTVRTTKFVQFLNRMLNQTLDIIKRHQHVKYYLLDSRYVDLECIRVVRQWEVSDANVVNKLNLLSFGVEVHK